MIGRLQKVLLSVTICLSCLIGLQLPASANSNSATILLDGYPLSFPIPPKIVNGYTMVPFRAISEAMGIQVEWQPDTQTITAKKGEKVVILQLRNPNITVNGQTVPLPVTPFETNGPAGQRLLLAAACGFNYT